MRSLPWLGLAAFGVLLSFHFLWRPGVFYSTDSAVNLLVIRPPAGRVPVDPIDRDLSPLRGTGGTPPPNNFLLGAPGGPMRSAYAPAFPVLTAPLLESMGLLGLYVVPAAGAALAAAAVAALPGAPAGPALVFLVALAATPLAFYGLLYWGHAPAAAMIACALLLLLRGRAGAGGFLAGVSGAIRSELLAAGPCLLLAVAPEIWRDKDGRRTLLRAAAGLACGWAVVAAINLASGHGLAGSHLGSYSPAGAYAPPDRAAALGVRARLALDAVVTYVGRNHRMMPDVNVLLVAPLVLTLFARGRFLRPCVAASVVAGALIAAFTALVHGQYATGMLVTCPLLALAGAGYRRAVETGGPVAAGRYALLAFLVTAALAPPGGWQWGPRYLLPALPLGAAVALQAAPAFPAATALLAACSVVCQAGAIRDLAMHRRALEPVAARAREAPAFLTDVWFLTLQLWPSLREESTFYLPSPGRLADALKRAGEARRALLVCGARETWQAADRYRPVAAAAGWTLSSGAAVDLPTGDRLQLFELTR